MMRGLLLAVAALIVLLAIFPAAIAPYDPQSRNTDYLRGAPTEPRFNFSDGFYVEGRVTQRNPTTLRLETTVDPATRWQIVFLVADPAAPYGFRLFGVEEGFVHFFGTDDLGRDLFSRVIHAIPVSFGIALVGALLTVVFGFVTAIVSLRFGGRATAIFVRTAEAIRSVPSIPIWIGLAAALPQDWSSTTRYAVLVLLFSLISWPHSFARLRSLLEPLVQEPRYIYYVRRDLPTTLVRSARYFGPLLGSFFAVEFIIQVPYLVIAETTLSFLGFGVAEPDLTFGVLFSKIRSLDSLIETPWYFLPIVAFCGCIMILFALADLVSREERLG